MRNTLIITVILFFFTTYNSFAQKYAYVNTDYILDNVPEYKSAQTELDNLSIQWQKEIEAKLSEIDKLYKAFQADQVLLPEEMKKKREDEIVKKEKEVKDLQKQRFGKDGELFKKRQTLVKPIQDKVYKAIEDVAADSKYDMILDKAGSTTILYVNTKLDKSNDVLEKMGLKAGKKEKKQKTE
ncbi:MAG: OmpH family outer membrane protein [Bacteroidota bacterium]|nr:OmpH family outer membrane protein [Bacteroidota bacterium]